MATLSIKDMQGTDAGTLEVSDSVFGCEPNKNAVRQTLLAFEANQRQGTHSTKTRAFVRGGGRKPYKQKGTGNARQGSIRAPQWRGGAIIFGPLPRGYDQKVNKKVRKLALHSALSDLRNGNKITVIKSFDYEQPKTSEFAGLLDRVGIFQARRILVLVNGENRNMLLSARNLDNVLVSRVENVNIYDLLTCDHLLATPESIKALEEQIA